MTSIVKCFYCKNNIDLTQKYDGSFVYDKKHYCHCHCFINYKTSLKKGKISADDCEKYLISLKKATNQIVLNTQYNKLFVEWYCNFYNKTILTPYARTLVSQVINGGYKDLTKRISIYELYEMFSLKTNELQNINTTLIAKNKARGKVSNADSLFAYDMAVIINEYDDYLERKEKIKQDKINRKRMMSERLNNNIDYSLYKNYHKQQGDNCFDIRSVIDEI